MFNNDDHYAISVNWKHPEEGFWPIDILVHRSSLPLYEACAEAMAVGKRKWGNVRIDVENDVYHHGPKGLKIVRLSKG